MKLLSIKFYERDPLEVAPELLGKVLVVRRRSDVRAGRIVEVEAYRGGSDEASHAYRGKTERNAVMFGPPGRLYVYFTYGMHFCANVVAHLPGVAGAVLIRALEPIEGIEEMKKARPKAKNLTDLTNGPAKLCQALGITKAFNGALLSGGEVKEKTAAARIYLFEDSLLQSFEIVTTPRIGIVKAADKPWRFYVKGSPFVSRPN